ncbi:MAG: hypothetical protein WCX97_03655 [Candidatus Magasanikbacteria bacterium]
MLIYIYGEDSFRSRQYLKEQVANFKKARDPQGYNVVFVNAKAAESGKVMSEVLSAPFLAEKRMVVLENVLSVSDKEFLGELIGRTSNCHPEPCLPAGRRSPKGGVEGSKSGRVIGSSTPLRSAQNDKTATKRGFPESNIIVFYQSESLSKVKEAKELDALLKKEKYAKEFELLHGEKLYAWANSEIKNRGGQISRAALTYLCDNINGDIWHLNTLIDQLVAYKSQHVILSGRSKGTPSGKDLDSSAAPQNDNFKEIQLVDIQLFLEEKLDDNIFNLIDAIVGGNKKLAFKLLAGQRKLGAEDGQIFGTMLWQFRILMSMRDLFEREDVGSSDILAKQLKIHPFVAKKNWVAMKKYSMEKLQSVYKNLLAIDIKTKTGLADQSLLLDLFVGRV